MEMSIQRNNMCWSKEKKNFEEVRTIVKINIICFSTIAQINIIWFFLKLHTIFNFLNKENNFWIFPVLQINPKQECGSSNRSVTWLTNIENI